MLLGVDKAKLVTLTDGTQVTIRFFKDSDRENLFQFYRQLPAEDRMFLKDDVTNIPIFENLLERIHRGRIIMLLAIHGKKIVGESALHVYFHGWTRHVGELRAVVLRDYVGKGLTRVLLREQIDVAISKGLDKIVFRILDTQKDARKALEELGFVKEAVLKAHATDLKGMKHDMLIMSNFVSELWRKMEDMIKDMEFEVIP